MIAQTALIKEFTDLGFSPITSLLLVALIAVVAYLKVQLSTQNTIRENWHTETRELVTKSENKIKSLEDDRTADRKRIDLCEDERNDLKTKVKALTDEVQYFRECEVTECPFRKRRKPLLPL